MLQHSQPEQVGNREYVWDALGRLVEVREEGQPLARYQYDHRDLRVGKTVGQQITHTLYDESRQPLAELDQEGRITRQTVWLADIPLGVIDSPAGQALAAEAPGLAQESEGTSSFPHETRPQTASGVRRLPFAGGGCRPVWHLQPESGHQDL